MELVAVRATKFPIYVTVTAETNYPIIQTTAALPFKWLVA